MRSKERDTPLRAILAAGADSLHRQGPSFSKRRSRVSFLVAEYPRFRLTRRRPNTVDGTCWGCHPRLKFRRGQDQVCEGTRPSNSPSAAFARAKSNSFLIWSWDGPTSSLPEKPPRPGFMLKGRTSPPLVTLEYKPVFEAVKKIGRAVLPEPAPADGNRNPLAVG